MFKISRDIIKNFSELGEIHRKIYSSWQNSLTQFNNYQKFSDYGYIRERISDT